MSEAKNPEDLSDDHDPSTGKDTSQPATPQELKSIEATLSALRPRDDRLDRERLVFLAGQASVHKEQPVQSST